MLMQFCMLMSIYMIFPNMAVTMIARMSFFYIHYGYPVLSGPICLFVIR